MPRRRAGPCGNGWVRGARTGSAPRHSKAATRCHSPPSATYAPSSAGGGGGGDSDSVGAAALALDHGGEAGAGARDTSLVRPQPLHRTCKWRNQRCKEEVDASASSVHGACFGYPALYVCNWPFIRYERNSRTPRQPHT